MNKFEDFLYWKAGYEKGADGIFRSMDDGSPLTEEQRATLEEICDHPTETFVRVSREATPDFPATLPAESPSEYDVTPPRLVAVLSVDHHPINQGALLDVWVQGTFASLHGGRLALYAQDFSSPALTYTHFSLVSAPDEQSNRHVEKASNFAENDEAAIPPSGRFATADDEEKILHAVAVEMALRANTIVQASKRFAAETEGRRG